MTVVLLGQSPLSNRGKLCFDFQVMNNKIKCLYLFLQTIFLILPHARAGVDPSIDWKVMQLSHFRLIYDAKQQNLAELYARRLEAHTETLKRVFPEIPDDIAFVINDNTDDTNGFSTPFPYPMIQVFPVLPGPFENIGEIGDWAHEISIHEMAHSLQFAPRSSFNQWLNYVFGSWVTPNMLLPRWLLEGQAVDVETRFSTKGRLRSTLQDASLRALVLGGEAYKPKIADINETSIPTFPYGSRPYLWGSLLASHMNELANSPEWMGETVKQYGGRVPYFLNGPALNQFDKTYSELLGDMYFELSGKVAAQLAHLRKVPTTEFLSIPFPDYKETIYPLISPDGKKVLFLSRGASLQRSLSLFIRDEKESWKKNKISTPASGKIERACWFADSKKILLDQQDAVSIFNTRSDLYVFDVESGKKKQITFNLRAREACPSPNGKFAAYVQISAGKTELGLINLESRSTRILVSTELQTRISQPVFANNNEILFVQRKNGTDTIQKYNLTLESVSQLLGPQNEIKFLNYENGKVIYSSSMNGVPNLYQIDFDTKKLIPITHAETGVVSGTYDKIQSQWLASVMTEEGIKIKSFKKSPTEVSGLPQIKPIYSSRYPAIEPIESTAKLPEPSEYWSFRYLYPRYWFPSFSTSNEGNQFGLNTGAVDPLGKHTFDLSYTYETKTNDQQYIFSYINQSFKPTAVLSTYQLEQTSPQSGFIFNSKVNEFYLRWDLRSILDDLTFDTGVYSQVDQVAITKADISLGRISGAQIHFQRRESAKTGELISPEAGLDFKFGFKYFKPEDRDSNSLESYFNFQKYWAKWLPQRHAILIQGNGAYVDHPEPSTRWKYSSLYQALPAIRETPPTLRGYSTGAFWGPSFFSSTFEYRLPLFNIYEGFGNLPAYLSRLHGSFFADSIQGKLRAYNSKDGVYEFVPQWNSFWSVGAELRLDTTIGNVLPIQFRLGVAKPLSPKYSQDDSQIYLTTGF